MKKIYKQFFISALSLTALLFISCDKADYTEDATIEAAQNVKGTIAFIAPLQASQTVDENNAGKYQYTINIDQEQPVDIHLKVKLKSGTATEGEDFTFDHDLVIKAFTKSVKGNIAILKDEVYEPTENFVLEVGGDINISNASIPANTISFKILNGLGDTLNISFAWDGENDYDMVTWNATTTPLEGWGDGGATTANPEHDDSIHLTDPVGTYYVNVMDWGAGEKFDYTFTITVAGLDPQVITGTFDGTDVSKYTNDLWTNWGGSYDSYRVLKVVNNGKTFVVTKL